MADHPPDPASDRRLPAGFEDLESWAEQWALSDPAARLAARQASAMESLEAFYKAIAPQLERILDHLDGRDRPLKPEEERLYWLTLSCAEVALAVEIYGVPKLPLAPGFDRFLISYLDMEPA